MFKKYLLIIFVIATDLIAVNLNKKQIRIYKKQLKQCELLKDPNEISKCKQNILMLMAAQTQKPKTIETDKNKKSENKTIANQENTQQAKKEDDTAQILTVFATIIANLGKLIINPYDPVNIGTSLSAMIAGMINIASHVTRSMPKINEVEAEEIVKHLDENTKKKLEIIYRNAILKIRKRCIQENISQD
jgi:hypothetical protein